MKPAHEGMTRRSSCKSTYDLQSPPNKREKNGPAQAEQRRSCHILYDGTEGLGLHTWDRYTELGKRGQNTLPALSRVPSAADQNYIILAPLNPGSQVGLGGCLWLRALRCSLSWPLLQPDPASSLKICESCANFTSHTSVPRWSFHGFPKTFPCCLPSGLAPGTWEGRGERSHCTHHTASHGSHFLLQKWFFPLSEVLWLGMLRSVVVTAPEACCR